MRRIPTLCIVACVTLAFFPSVAAATAGIAERQWGWEYNDYVTISTHWGDFCRGCIAVEEKFFLSDDGWYLPQLERISVPLDSSSPFIFAQSLTVDYEGEEYDQESEWLIYNLQTRKRLLQSKDYATVLATWVSLGLEEPQFSTYDNVDDYFEETAESKKTNSFFGMAEGPVALLYIGYFAILLPLLGFGSYLIVLCLFGYLTYQFLRKYKESRKRDHLVLTIAFGFLTLLYIAAGATPFVLLLIFRAMGSASAY